MPLKKVASGVSSIILAIRTATSGNGLLADSSEWAFSPNVQSKVARNSHSTTMLIVTGLFDSDHCHSFPQLH